MQWLNLNGKVVVITGAGSGIGRETAKQFSQAGASVIMIDRNGEPLSQISAEFSRMGFKADELIMDITDETKVESGFRQIVRKWNAIDVVVNCAGVSLNRSSFDIREEDWNRVLNVNVKGLFYCSREAANVMKKRRKGSVINIASQLGFIGKPAAAVYTASKAAVINLTKSLALEWVGYGIRVNAVAPGPIWTNMTNYLKDDDEKRKQMIRRIPLERLGMPEEIAAAVLFLASERASYIIGHTLVVDGGYTIL